MSLLEAKLYDLTAGISITHEQDKARGKGKKKKPEKVKEMSRSAFTNVPISFNKAWSRSAHKQTTPAMPHARSLDGN